jgi:hypothetical protein
MAGNSLTKLQSQWLRTQEGRATAGAAAATFSRRRRRSNGLLGKSLDEQTAYLSFANNVSTACMTNV